MAFASTITEVVPGGQGSRAMAYGTYTNGAGDTGGDITTGLSTVLYFELQPDGSAVSTNASVVNETFPISTAVTIVTDLDEDGQWRAVGY